MHERGPAAGAIKYLVKLPGIVGQRPTRAYEKNLIVQVYKQDNTFKARIVWFYDEVDTVLVNTRLDEKNPDKALRSRKIIGLDVLSGLVYNPRQNKWTGGKIYDTHSGKTWKATVRLTSPDLMTVRGFYGVQLLGKTLNFTRL